MSSFRRTFRWLMISASLLLPSAFGLRLSVAPAEPPQDRGMTPEQWEGYQKRDRVAEALSILDDPEWHKNDWVIREKREQNARQTEDKRTPIEGYIRHREVTALHTVIESDMPRGGKQGLLTKYLAHHNPQVALEAFGTLASSGMWSPEQCIAHVRAKYPNVRGWLMLLGLPKGTPVDVRRGVARELIATAKNDPIDYQATNSATGGAEIEAVRVLVASDDPADHALIAWAVRQYPGAPLLWAAISRHEAPDDLVELAREVFNDASKPKELRAAAALVFGKDDRQTMETVLGWIEDYLREFGGEGESLARMRLAAKIPPEPKGGELIMRMSDGLVFFGVLREMPKDVLEPAVERLITAGPEMVEKMTGPVLARTVPAAFVRYWKTRGKPPPTVLPALYLAGHFAPEVTSEIRTLIPAAELSNLAKIEAERGVEPLADLASRMTLWD